MSSPLTTIPDHRTRCLMTFDDKILVMVRTFKNGPTVLLPGGGIDEGETSVDGIKREIKEELSFDVKTNPLLFYTYKGIRDLYEEEKADHPEGTMIEDIFDFYHYRWITLLSFSQSHSLMDKAKDF